MTDAGGRVLTFAFISNNAGPTGARRSTRWPATLDPAGARVTAASTPTIGAAVDWEFAATVGTSSPGQAPPASDYTRRQAIDELASPARKAESPVRDVTRLEAPSARYPTARIVDRPEWIRAATESMRVMTSGDRRTAAADSSPAGSPGHRPVRCWRSSRRGSSVSTTRSRQTGGVLLLVYPNVIAVERQLRVKPADFRLWVCLHEVTHRVQFTRQPLAGRLHVACAGGADPATAVKTSPRRSAARRVRPQPRRRRGAGPNSGGRSSA